MVEVVDWIVVLLTMQGSHNLCDHWTDFMAASPTLLLLLREAT